MPAAFFSARLSVRKLAHEFITCLSFAPCPCVYCRCFGGQQAHRELDAIGMRPARRVGLATVPFVDDSVDLFLGNLLQGVYHLRLLPQSRVLSVGGVIPDRRHAITRKRLSYRVGQHVFPCRHDVLALEPMLVAIWVHSMSSTLSPLSSRMPPHHVAFDQRFRYAV